MIRFNLPGIGAPEVHRPQTLAFVGFGDRNSQGAPIARVNSQAGYGLAPGFEPVVEEMPPLVASGYLHAVLASAESIFEVSASNSIPVWERKGLPSPNSAWTGTHYIFFFSLSPESTVSLCLTAKGAASPRNDNSFYVSLPSSVTADLVSIGGAAFQPAVDPISPKQGEFVQQGSTLIAYNPDGWTVSLGEADISGTLSSEVNAIAEAAYYDTTGLESDSIDEVVHLGRSYRRGLDINAPEIGSFYMASTGFMLLSEVGKSDRVPLPPPPATSSIIRSSTVVNAQYTREV